MKCKKIDKHTLRKKEFWLWTISWDFNGLISTCKERTKRNWAYHLVQMVKDISYLYKEKYFRNINFYPLNQMDKIICNKSRLWSICAFVHLCTCAFCALCAFMQKYKTEIMWVPSKISYVHNAELYGKAYFSSEMFPPKR